MVKDHASDKRLHSLPLLMVRRPDRCLQFHFIAVLNNNCECVFI